MLLSSSLCSCELSYYLASSFNLCKRDMSIIEITFWCIILKAILAITIHDHQMTNRTLDKLFQLKAVFVIMIPDHKMTDLAFGFYFAQFRMHSRHVAAALLVLLLVEEITLKNYTQKCDMGAKTKDRQTDILLTERKSIQTYLS